MEFVEIIVRHYGVETMVRIGVAKHRKLELEDARRRSEKEAVTIERRILRGDRF